MNINKYKISIVAFLIAVLSLSSCYELDTEPISETEVTSVSVFRNPESYKQVLARLYAGLSIGGQEGPGSKEDIRGIDSGFGQFLRGYWMAQELTTDEALVSWNDQTIKNYHFQTWTSTDVFITALYYRVFYQIALTNEYIRETSEARLDDRGVTGTLREEIKMYRAEARFLRALSYWHGLDLFGNIPFVTDNDPVGGTFLPEQADRATIFAFIESELLDIEADLAAPRNNEYARADQAAAWMLLAKLYLNAEVYLGANQKKYTECITYCNKIIEAGYGLEQNYQYLFLADNHLADEEIIFPIVFDGNNTRWYGGTTYIIAAALNGEWGDVKELFGTASAWGGNRTTKALVEKFPENDSDTRKMFWTEGHELEIDDVADFFQGYGVVKFKNLTRNDVPGSDDTFVDTDFPMYRLADVYLMYAEAVLRGGTGGSMANAVNYINLLRQRAYGDTSGNITQSNLTLDFIIDERARELYWEAHRRTDLIRFGRFSQSDYVWPWKGAVRDGRSTNSKFNLFPIPAADLGANPQLKQNTGY